MQIRLRRAQSVLSSSLALLLLAFVAVPSRAAEKVHLRVDDYQIQGRTYSSSPSDFSAGQGQIHCPSGSHGRRLRIAQ